MDIKGEFPEEQSYARIRAVQRELTGQPRKWCKLVMRPVVRIEAETALVSIAR